MESWGVLFLGVVAFSAVVQVVFLVGLLKVFLASDQGAPPDRLPRPERE
jgi:hypothetical protein